MDTRCRCSVATCPLTTPATVARAQVMARRAPDLLADISVVESPSAAAGFAAGRALHGRCGSTPSATRQAARWQPLEVHAPALINRRPPKSASSLLDRGQRPSMFAIRVVRHAGQGGCKK